MGRTIYILLSFFISANLYAICDNYSAGSTDFISCMQNQCQNPSLANTPMCNGYTSNTSNQNDDPLASLGTILTCTQHNQCSGGKGCYAGDLDQALNQYQKSKLDQLQSSNENLLANDTGDTCQNNWDCESNKCDLVGTIKQCVGQKFCRFAQVGENAPGSILCQEGLLKDQSSDCVSAPATINNYPELFAKLTKAECVGGLDTNIQTAATSLHLTAAANEFLYKASRKNNDKFKFAKAFEEKVIDRVISRRNDAIEKLNEKVKYILDSFNTLKAVDPESEEEIVFLEETITQKDLYHRRATGDDMRRLMIKLEEARKEYDLAQSSIYGSVKLKAKSLLNDFLAINYKKCYWKVDGTTHNNQFLGTNMFCTKNKKRGHKNKWKFDNSKTLSQMLDGMNLQKYEVKDYLNELGISQSSTIFDDNTVYIQEEIYPGTHMSKNFVTIADLWKTRINNDLKNNKLYKPSKSEDQTRLDYLINPDLNIYRACTQGLDITTEGIPEGACENYDKTLNRMAGRAFTHFIMFALSEDKKLKGGYFSGNSADDFPSEDYSSTYQTTAGIRNDNGQHYPIGYENLSNKSELFYQTYLNYFFLEDYHKKVTYLRDKRIECIANSAAGNGPGSRNGPHVNEGNSGDDKYNVGDTNLGGGGGTGGNGYNNLNNLGSINSGYNNMNQSPGSTFSFRDSSKLQKSYLTDLAKRNGLDQNAFLSTQDPSKYQQAQGLNDILKGNGIRAIASQSNSDANKNKKDEIRKRKTARYVSGLDDKDKNAHLNQNQANSFFGSSHDDGYGNNDSYVEMAKDQQNYILDNMNKIEKSFNGDFDSIFKRISKAYVVSGYPRLLKRKGSRKPRVPASKDLTDDFKRNVPQNIEKRTNILNRLRTDF